MVSIVMKHLFGKWHGHIPSLDPFWHPVRTMVECLFGKNKTMYGHVSRNIMFTQLQVYLKDRNATRYTKFMLLIVNSVAWAPHELGAMLACASSDGKISVLEYRGKRDPMDHKCHDAYIHTHMGYRGWFLGNIHD